MTLEIRPATRTDAATLLELIRALADYERAADQVQTTVEDILRDGFGDRPLFSCLIAEWSGVAVGYALYFNVWSTWTGTPSFYLEDLFVQPDHRKRGIGLALLRSCARVSLDQGCQRFEFAVLDWNTPARDFYHQLGAFHKEDWLPYRIEGTALAELAEGR